MGVAIGNSVPRLLVPLSIPRLTQIQIAVTKVAPVTTQIVGNYVMEIVRQGRHLAVLVVRSHAKIVVPIW